MKPTSPTQVRIKSGNICVKYNVTTGDSHIEFFLSTHVITVLPFSTDIHHLPSYSPFYMFSSDMEFIDLIELLPNEIRTHSRIPINQMLYT